MENGNTEIQGAQKMWPQKPEAEDESEMICGHSPL